MAWSRGCAGGWLLLRLVLPYWACALAARWWPQRAGRWRVRIHTYGAVILHRHLVRWGALQIKIGQYLAARPDIMPAAYIERLENLRDQVPARPFAVIQPILDSAFNGDYRQHFASIDAQALAAASFGQVHRGELCDGTAVAVKVQYPGLRAAVASDLRLVRLAMRIFKRLLPGWPLHQLVAEIERTAADELNYLVEARAAEALRKPLGRYAIRVPQVIRAVTRETILTTELVPGQSLSRAVITSLSAEDRHSIAQRVIDGFLAQVLEMRWFHADPHAGNFLLVQHDKQASELWLIDFGMTGTISSAEAELYARFLLCVQQDDTDGMVDIITELGVVVPGADQTRLKDLARDLYRELSSVPGAAIQGSARQIELAAQVNRFIREMEGVSLPRHALMLSRSLGLIEGLCMDLVPESTFIELVQPRAERFLSLRARIGWAIDATIDLWRDIRTLPKQIASLVNQADQRPRVQRADPVVIAALVLIASLLVSDKGGWQLVAASAAGLALILGLIGSRQVR